MEPESKRAVRTGWTSRLTLVAIVTLAFETASGLAVTLAPFHPAVQWGLLAHTVAGLLLLAPLAWYSFSHWNDYRHYRLSDIVLLGYVALVALLVCAGSGAVVTWQGTVGVRTTPLWRQVHLVSTLALIAALVPHLVLLLVRLRGKPLGQRARAALLRSGACTAAALLVCAVPIGIYRGPVYDNRFPADYSLLFGKDRPFAPSLAVTDTGGAFDSDSLSGSETCGTAGCHDEIVEEWRPSAHRYAAMDPLFQGIQKVMAKQNGAESTRYCGGCHDPVSLFSGTKNIFVADLTGLQGFQEGVSCLSCHSIRQTDVQGNANYVMTQPSPYLWQWADRGAARIARDFLIRTYPAEHARLSKRMFKSPEYCAACHKQFIDKEVNNVGWVQLQNQYDNWKASHWFHEGDADKTVECRECHMPLVDSHDPAAGDPLDHNRSASDGKHRSHRFVAANNMIPRLLELPGWQEHVALTERWLAGRYEIPEIAAKWAEGPVVAMQLEAPPEVRAGEPLALRVVLTANKVGHDFPTGPLDIIQSWVELEVKDAAGQVVFASGRRDARGMIEPGSFLFKAEPVDQYGNLIDRHNLWEMVGVRYRRSLFPGTSDTVDYRIDCSGVGAARAAEGSPAGEPVGPVASPAGRRTTTVELTAPSPPGTYTVTARLLYRKVDQFLLDYLLGETSGVTAPVVEMNRATAVVPVVVTVATRPPVAPVPVQPAGGG